MTFLVYELPKELLQQQRKLRRKWPFIQRHCCLLASLPLAFGSQSLSKLELCLNISGRCGINSLLYDRRLLFLGDGGFVSTVIAGSCFRKASENQSFIFLPPLDLSPETTRYVGGGWSMVDGSDETTQIVFGECLARSAWDTDEIAME
ncbi:unnamed protein product [Brassica rapa subsp. trilocularis]